VGLKYFQWPKTSLFENDSVLIHFKCTVLISQCSGFYKFTVCYIVLAMKTVGRDYASFHIPVSQGNKCEWLILNAMWSIVSYFMATITCMILMIMSALYYTNTFSWIFIVLTHRTERKSADRHVARLETVCLIPSQLLFLLNP